MSDSYHNTPTTPCSTSLSSIDENTPSSPVERKKLSFFDLGSPKEVIQRLLGYHTKTKRTLPEEAESGDEVSVCTWIKNGVNPNDTDAYGYTPLLNASIYGRLVAVIELIKNGADINKPGPYGYTPLHAAAQNGHSEVVSVLLKHGALLDAQNDDKDTPMHLAIKSQQIEIVYILLRNGGNPKIAGFMNKDCSQCAMECGLFDVAQTLENYNPSYSYNNHNFSPDVNKNSDLKSYSSY